MATVEPGMVISGRYELLHTIGSGGMSKVWLANDRLLDRNVAVKILSDRYASDPDFVERFRREASAAAGLSHPNIVGVYDRGESAGSYYIVMEHLPGPDLKAIIRQRGRLDPRQAVDATLQVLSALSASHRRNIIHRDIKPQNVLVADDGLLKVTDFGIARAGEERGMTEIGAVIGTAQYLSPEQARGEEVTPASDCYAVGILLYEMLTGKVPFDGDTPVSIAMRQINEAPVAPRVALPQLSPALNDIVMKALEKRPGARFRTAEEFTQALLAVRETLPESVEDPTQVLAAGPGGTGSTRVVTGPITNHPTAATRMQTRATPPPAPSPYRRRRGVLIGAILALLVLAGGAAAYLFTDIGRDTRVTIPTVRGELEADARAELELLRLKVTSVPVNDKDLPKGQVVRTEPAEGSKAEKDSSVSLYVSDGPDLDTVPGVVGQDFVDAKAALEERKFVVAREDQFSDKPAGVVIDQKPKRNSQVDEGSTVTLVVSKGPELVAVPNLKLESQQAAQGLLEDEGLELGETTLKESTRPPGTIIGQDPEPGKKIEKGSKVNITVAKKPEPKTVAVPNVAGLPATEAQAKLEGLGFTVKSDSSPDETIPEGSVIATQPPADTQVDPATETITIIVSTGPDQAPPTETPTPGTP